LQAKTTVALFQLSQGEPSEGFVDAQGRSLRRYRPVSVCLSRSATSGERTSDETVVALDERLSAKAMKDFVETGDASKVASVLASVANPALIHSHFGPAALIAQPIARRLGIPHVATFHGFDATTRAWRLLLSKNELARRYARKRRKLLGELDLIIGVSRFLTQRLSSLGAPSSHLKHCFLGIDLESWPAALWPRSKTIAHVARLVEVKGTSVLIEAMPLVLEGIPEARLEIIGDGPLRPQLQRLAKRLRVKHAVMFHGSQPSANVRELMQRATVVCQPSVPMRSGYVEAFGLAALEGAASGTPSVATAVGGIPEVVVHNETGLLVEPRDPIGIARALVALLSDENLAAGMGQAARTRAVREFDQARWSGALEDMYDDVLSGRTSAMRA
jgi:colanic acid/amylovoran biosynthesis glycosyltransferase